MNCSQCKNKVGDNYLMNGIVLCHHCSTPFDTAGMIGKYIGLYDDRHIYRVHKSVRCSGCGTRLFLIRNPCSDSGLEKEISELFSIKEKSSV